MNRREALEANIVRLQRKMNTAPPDTPDTIRKAWEKDLVNLEFKLNNLSDGDQDNNL